MPSSPLKWNSYAKSDCQQVFGLSYGIKRKTNDDGQQTLSDCLSNQTSEYPSKRPCLWPQQEEQLESQRMLPNSQSADEMMTEECPSDDQRRASNATSPGYNAGIPTQQPTPLQQNNNVHQHPTRSAYDMDMVMNIKGDDEAMEEYSSAYDAMDGEGAVDPSQYGRGAPVLHEQHCFGMEKSPNSERVRCHCVPAWDTLLSNKAYYSDIY